MANRRTIFAKDGAKPAGQYSHAIIANGFVFVSGQGSRHPQTNELPPDFAGEVRQALSNVEAILTAADTALFNIKGTGKGAVGRYQNGKPN